jgi:hypothetical protein
MAILDAELKADPACHPFPADADTSAIPPRPGLMSYVASITVDYRGKGHIEVRAWQGDDRVTPLTPWPAYVDYTLTGGRDVIWFNCQTGFRVQDIAQTPENPNAITYDPQFLTGTTLQDLEGTNVITFRCSQKSERAHPKPNPSKLNPK